MMRPLLLSMLIVPLFWMLVPVMLRMPLVLGANSKLPLDPMAKFTIEADVAVTGPPLITASKLPLGKTGGLSLHVSHSAFPLGGSRTNCLLLHSTSILSGIELWDKRAFPTIPREKAELARH